MPSAASAGEADAPQRVIIDPEVSRRVSALEQRMSEIDVQSRSAVGNADRAEGLLVAFAARRALDRGVGLGFLEGLLRQRFGQSQPRGLIEHPHFARPAPPQGRGERTRRHHIARAIAHIEQRGIAFELVGPQCRQPGKARPPRQRTPRVSNLDCHETLWC